MKQRILKISKIVAITLISITLLLAITIGIVFEFILTPEKITPKVVQAINKSLNAELSIEAIELTFFKTFPNFKLELKNGFILNTRGALKDLEFISNDTLIKFDYGVISVNPVAFIGNSIEINKFSFEKPSIYTFVSSDGETNWDILKKTDPIEIDSIDDSKKERKNFDASINIEEISIINGRLIFDDRYSENFMTVESFDMNLEAQYNENDAVLKLKSQSDNVITKKKGRTYTNQLSVVLNTDFHVNRKTKIIDLKKAKVGINDIQFVVIGKLNPNRLEKQIDVDLQLDLEIPTLNTLIDLIPETVFDKTEDYTAKGDVSLKADIKGIYKKAQIPAINTWLTIHNGSVAYKEKSNEIELIEADIEAYISPQIRTGSYFKFNHFTLKGVGTEINIQGHGKNLFENPELKIALDGDIDLNALENSLPFNKNLNLQGSGKVHLNAAFNLNDIRNQDYGKIQALGTLDMDQIIYHNESDSLQIKLDKANIHIERDQNSTLLTTTSTMVTGGKVLVQNLEFIDGKNSRGNLDKLDIKFATTSLKDSTKIAVIKSSVMIEEGRINLGDSLVASLKYISGKFEVQPNDQIKTVPAIHSIFQIDSVGIKSKGRFFAILDGSYDISATKMGKKWPMDGFISFDQLYAYTPTFPLLLKMPKTKVTFKPGVISLDHAKIKIGDSDIEATGKVYQLGDAFFDNKKLRGELGVSSQMININELIETLLKGAKQIDKDTNQILLEDQEKEVESVVNQPRSFVVPERLDLELKSNFKDVKYKDFQIKDVEGIITIRDQKIDLGNLQMTTMAAKMSTSVSYESKLQGVAAIDFDFALLDIDLSKLTELFPLLDTVLPMANSFEGKVKFRMKGVSKVDKNLGISASSLNGIARVEGDSLVILTGKTFEKMAKMLFFKNKERNTIDKLEFAMIFKDMEIEIFPSVVTVDRYKVAIGGQHNLDLTYDYHVSILKSPMPFKAGLDLKGTEEDMDFKITKAKYKHLFSRKKRSRKKADSTLIRRKNSVINNLPFYN